MENESHVVKQLQVEKIESVGSAHMYESSQPSRPILSIKLKTVTGQNFDLALREATARDLHQSLGDALKARS